jgi:RES domain-containing protein
MEVWRLFPKRFRDSAFSGVGGLYAASRWGRQGVAMVYTATSPALAVLEFFVNLEPNEAPSDLLLAEALVPDGLAEVLDLRRLHRNWRTLDSLQCRRLGSEWALSGRSVALKVPSAAVAGDWNVLLNPRHADFNRVTIVAVKPFRYDPRMFR